MTAAAYADPRTSAATIRHDPSSQPPAGDAEGNLRALAEHVLHHGLHPSQVVRTAAYLATGGWQVQDPEAFAAVWHLWYRLCEAQANLAAAQHHLAAQAPARPGEPDPARAQWAQAFCERDWWIAQLTAVAEQLEYLPQ